MAEIFKGFTLELVMNNIYYEVESATFDAMKNFIVVAIRVDNIVYEAELIIGGSQRTFASAKVKIRESWVEKDRTMLACEAPPKDFHFFKRNFLRLETDIPVEYIIMKAGAQDLQPVSQVCRGTINDISPCGALLVINKRELLFNPKDPSLYVKLAFSLPSDSGNAIPLEIVAKMVNLKKSWDNYQLGMLFLVNSFQQYRALEQFYKETIASRQADPGENIEIHQHIKKILTTY